MAAYMKRDDVIVLLVANLAGPLTALHGNGNVEDQVIALATSYADKLQAKGVIGEQSLTDAFASLRARVSETLPPGDLDLADDLDDDDTPEVSVEQSQRDSDLPPAPEGQHTYLTAETGVFTTKSDTEPAPPPTSEANAGAPDALIAHSPEAAPPSPTNDVGLDAIV